MLQDRSASVGRGDKQLRKPGSIHPKLGQQSARLNYPATLNSFRRCVKVIDTSLQPTMGREVSRLRCCRLIQRHPASPASSSIRLTAVAPANTRPPDLPTNIYPKPIAVEPRSCRPQSRPRVRHSARLERAAATQWSQSECDAKCASIANRNATQQASALGSTEPHKTTEPAATIQVAAGSSKLAPVTETGPRQDAAQEKARRGHGWPGGRKVAGTGTEQTRFRSGKQGVVSKCDAKCDAITADRVELLARKSRESEVPGTSTAHRPAHARGSAVWPACPFDSLALGSRYLFHLR
jgi:hypothetical protein